MQSYYFGQLSYFLANKCVHFICSVAHKMCLLLWNMHAQSYPTLWDLMDCSLPGSSIHGILQARILEWIATSYSRGYSWFRGQIDISCYSCIGRWILYHWATWEAHFLNRFIVFFLLGLRVFQYILVTFYQICDFKIFSPISDLAFHSVSSILQKSKVLISMVSNLSFFFIIDYAFVLYLRNLCLTWGHKDFFFICFLNMKNIK